MKGFCRLMILLLVTALLAACAPAANPEQTTGTEERVEPTTPTTLPIADDLFQPKEHEASVFRFLQDTNHNGTITPSAEAVPPGTLPEVWQIPQPDQSIVGQTVDIVLAKDQEMTPFYYVCTEPGAEHLYVFVSAKIPMLIQFKTQLGGIQGLYNHIENKKVFQGKIIAMVNLSYEEGNVYAYNVCSSQENVSQEEILSNGTDLSSGNYFGVVGSRETGKGWEQELFLKGTMIDCVSEGLGEALHWMAQLRERFGLTLINS